MKYRVLGGVVGLGLALGLFYGLESLLAPRYAIAVAMGAGTGAFLVLDGSAGAGESWIYHRVRSNGGKVQDAASSIGGGVLGGILIAMLTEAIYLGEFGASILVGVAALLGANFVYLRKRPNYEQQLEDME